MMQMYFLSIVFNVIAGLILLNTKQNSEKEVESDKKQKLIQDVNKKLASNEVLSNKTFTLVIGILSLLTGIIKFFCVAKGGLLILGDLIPAVTGIAVGFAILLHYYLSTATTESNLPKFLQVVFIDNIYWVGITSIVVAVLHFIMPGVLFF